MVILARKIFQIYSFKMVFDQNLEGRFLLLINERKSKKMACDKETLLHECAKQFAVQENLILMAIHNLKQEDQLTENKRSGIKLLAN